MVRHFQKRFIATPLIHCSVRLYPHLQDSGGFFLAVLEKKNTSTALAGSSYGARYVPEINLLLEM